MGERSSGGGGGIEEERGGKGCGRRRINVCDMAFEKRMAMVERLEGVCGHCG